MREVDLSDWQSVWKQYKEQEKKYGVLINTILAIKHS